VLVEINQRQYELIGFKNNSGGYELRGTNDFKSTVTPKDFSFIQNDDKPYTNAVAVVEGMFDFLSLLEKQDSILPEISNYLILNSLSFFEKAIPLIEEHKKVYLLLDNDKAGKSFTSFALKRSLKYTDLSDQYKDSKDLNEWLVKGKNYEQQMQMQEAERTYRSGFRR
jgi:5S rRNA maturation endonuclease (ribonuclease M5)